MATTSPSPATTAAPSPTSLPQVPHRPAAAVAAVAAAAAAPSCTASGKPSSPPPPFHQIPPAPPPIAYAFPTSLAFPPRPVRPLSSDQIVTVAANLGRNGPLLPLPTHSNSRPYTFVPDHSMRPAASHPLPRPTTPVAATLPTVLAPGPRILPSQHHPPKIDQFPTIPSIADFKNRDKSIEDSVVVVNGRKVRMRDGSSTSLYALCRSWVRNGVPQENQSQFVESGFPRRALPVRMTEDTHTSKENEALDDDTKHSGEDESVGSVDDMSIDELLKEHVKRAKKVRARIREERLQKIHPYRQRLYSIIEKIQQAEADPCNESSLRT